MLVVVLNPLRKENNVSRTVRGCECAGDVLQSRDVPRGHRAGTKLIKSDKAFSSNKQTARLARVRKAIRKARLDPYTTIHELQTLHFSSTVGVCTSLSRTHKRNMNTPFLQTLSVPLPSIRHEETLRSRLLLRPDAATGVYTKQNKTTPNQFRETHYPEDNAYLTKFRSF